MIAARAVHEGSVSRAVAEPFVDGRSPAGALARELGVRSALGVVVGTTIGSGIFRVPSLVAAETGSTPGIVAVWILGALLSLCGAVTLAEAAARHPRSGGIYVFLREAYGPRVAFLFGWTQLILIRPSALGAIAMIFASYLADFVPLGPTDVRLVAVAAIVAVSAVNARSLRWSAAFENATVCVKVLALASLAVLALAVSGPAPSVDPSVAPMPHWSGYGVALVAVLWAYDGWADLTFMAGEVRAPWRTFPRALIGGVVTVMVVYLLVNAAYLRILDVGEMAGSSMVAAAAAERIAGGAGSRILAALVVVSTLGALNGAMMTGPRVFFAMAADGHFPRRLAAVHARWGTPWASIALAAGLGVGYVSVRSFEQLAAGFVLGIWPFYALAVAAVVLERRRHSERPSPYEAPLHPLLPALFLVASVGLIVSALIETRGVTLVGFALIALGLPAQVILRRGGSTPSRPTAARA